ncbi:uncharacterized protein LOC107047484 [Diachasma alloeum]|uniref:uncharacterized protein LOC107047484 n=1 Tax=Diachasma alloeum TaxID=454923 RepID=UPI000738359A|nr:uncharacterized protein LOC107047484 [Diachasma alloeum]
MWKQFSLQGTYKWIPIVKNLVQSYNDSKHRTIRMKPKDVTVADEKYRLHHVYGKLKAPHTKRIKFKVGDKVRVSKYKNIFEKGYTPNWSTEIFTISKVIHTKPVTYKLIDYEEKPIEGGFYQEELTKVTHPDVYLVEKVLTRHDRMATMKRKRDTSFCDGLNKIALQESSFLPMKKIDELKMKKLYKITEIRFANTRYGTKALVVLKNKFTIWLPGRISCRLLEEQEELNSFQQAANEGVLNMKFLEDKHHPCEFLIIGKDNQKS